MVQTSCAIVSVQLCNQLMKIFGSKRPGILLLLSATKKFINSFHLTRVAMNLYDVIRETISCLYMNGIRVPHIS